MGKNYAEVKRCKHVTATFFFFFLMYLFACLILLLFSIYVVLLVGAVLGAIPLAQAC